jgi:hypothetical protein
MKYAVEMGLSAMMYIPSFRKNWFRHSKVNSGDSQTQRSMTSYVMI